MTSIPLPSPIQENHPWDPRSDDVLAQTLRALHLRGTVYFQTSLRSPWGMAIPARPIAAFHVIVSGHAYLRMDGEEVVRLDEGDVVLLPHGRAHALVDAAGTPAAPPEKVLRNCRPEASDPPDARQTEIVCGHFEIDHAAHHPFFATLPERVHVRLQGDERAQWLAGAARLAAAESPSGEAGASVIVDRLAEVLLLQTLRSFLAASATPKGFLAAAADPSVGRALAAIHTRPEHPWTVEALAKEAHLSRTAFAERFRRQLGEPPVRYLTRWRMILADGWLEDRAMGLAEIAERVGYGSEFAFAKAYKRERGVGPGGRRGRG